MLLNNGCDLVVTDCPIELTCYYTDYNQLEGFTGIVNVATEFNKKYPATRILVQREGNFSPIGRYQGEEESKKIDRDIISFVSTFFGQEIKEMTYNQALNYVKENF